MNHFSPRQLLVLSEASDQLAPSASARDISQSTESARLAGASVYHIPQDFSKCENAANALGHIPDQVGPATGFWVGYIPDPDRYEDIYRAATEKGIRLINSPEEHLTAQEFDRAYARLGELTPSSKVVSDQIQARLAADAIGYPVFVKGVVQSRKSRGWKACVAENIQELEIAVENLFALEARTRGRVVVRKLVRLRHGRISPQGFPLGREYRIFLLQHQIVGLGYYWEGEDALKSLSPNELEQVSNLAKQASKRMQVPFLAVDIGQLEDGSWIVIETGDGQFSGLSQINPLSLWVKIRAKLE